MDGLLLRDCPDQASVSNAGPFLELDSVRDARNATWRTRAVWLGLLDENVGTERKSEIKLVVDILAASFLAGRAVALSPRKSSFQSSRLPG